MHSVSIDDIITKSFNYIPIPFPKFLPFYDISCIRRFRSLFDNQFNTSKRRCSYNGQI